MEGRPDGDVERALATFGGVSLRYFSFGSTAVRAPGYADETAADEYADRQSEPDIRAAVAPDPYIPGPHERVSEVFPLIGQAVPEAREVNVEPQWSLIDSAYGTDYSARSEADVPPELASGPAMAPTHESYAYQPPPEPHVHEPQGPAAPPADQPIPRLVEPEPPPVAPSSVAPQPVEPARSPAFTPPRSFGVRPIASTMPASSMPSWPQREVPPPADEPEVEHEISPHAHEDFPTPEFTAQHPSDAAAAAQVEAASPNAHPADTPPFATHHVEEHEADALPSSETAPPATPPAVPATESVLDLPEQHPAAEPHEAALQPARHAETVTVAHEEPAIDDLTPLTSYAAPDPEPLSPAPVTPAPVTPELVTPEPVTPEPVTSEPFHPHPLTPEPPAAEPPAIAPAPVALPSDKPVPPPRGRQTLPTRQSAALGGLFRARKDAARPPSPPPASDALQDVFRRL